MRRRPPLGGMLRRGLERVTETPVSRGNVAQLLVDGPTAYPAMLDAIAHAERCVHFENYIFRADDVGRRFAEALAERAMAGIKVRVLYDWIGCLRTPHSFWSDMRDAGVDVRVFGKPSPLRPHRIWRRDHRKLVVVDGSVAIVGGLCIGQEWQDDGGDGCWRDTAVQLAGPIVADLDRTFAGLWRRAGGAELEKTTTAQPVGAVDARVVDGPPAHARAYRLYQLIATLAERTVFMTDAYPLAPALLRRALASAARDGVDVRLLAPGESDVPLFHLGARGHYDSLLRSGVRIYEWNGPMLHAKTVVADAKWGLVGSSNLNPFSLFGNHELDIELQDQELGRRLEEQFLSDLEHAHEITPAAWAARPVARKWLERLAARLLWLPYRVYDT